MRLRNIPTAREELASSRYVIPEDKITSYRGKWSCVFNSGAASAPRTGENTSTLTAEGRRALYIEIGMGKGRFLLEMARLHPDTDFIGIEQYSSVLVHAVRSLERPQQGENPSSYVPDFESAKAQGSISEPLTPEHRAAPYDARAPLTNVLLIRANAEYLTDCFAEGEVNRIYLNFSDPWPKDRHAKRRLPGRVFLARYEKVLAPGGSVEFKTDNRALFDFALEEAKASGWALDAVTYDLHHDRVLMKGNVMTEYEEKFSAKGNPICKLIMHPDVSQAVFQTFV